MTEAAFPLLGAAFVVLIVLPLFAVLAKVGLVLLERDDVDGPLHGLNLRYLLLTGSGVLPLAWLLSAALHQTEGGSPAALACLLDHDTAALCFEPGLFALTLGLVVLVASVPVLRGWDDVELSSSDGARALAARIEALIVNHPSIALLRGRVRVTEAPSFALATRGLITPYVIIGSSYAAQLSDEMLAGALGHECEHVRSRDPLRFLVLRLALAINPIGRFLLEPHAARWRAAREAHCDREAVIDGAAPLSLAEAIIQAARPSAREMVALGAADTTILRFRIAMLFAFAEQTPARCCHRGLPAFPVACVLLVLVLLLPHQAGTGALDVLHTGTERAFTYFWR